MSEENKQVYKPLTYEQIKVKEILLTQIRVDNHFHSGKVSINNGIINSAQSYVYDDGSRSFPDPDMSDFAVIFYGILYKKTVLNKESKISKKIFAGDTMNSYNSVAKCINIKLEETSDESKRKILISLMEEWKKRYHCLANFWLIPYSIGRTSPKWSRYDSLDIFLLAVKNNVPKKERTNHEYFDTFRKGIDSTIDYYEFLRFHYLNNYETVEQKIDEIIKIYKKSPDKIIKKMIECIELRADNIVRNEKVCNELYDFFKNNNLL